MVEKEENIMYECKPMNKNFDSGYKKFKLLILGQTISSIGSGMTAFGLAIYILKITGSVTTTGIFSICAFLPSILLAPVGGVLADRYDRRWMMILGELLSAVGLSICILAVMKKADLVWILIGIGISSIFTALTEPAFKATVTDLLPEEKYSKASGMMQLANSAKLIISPMVAGLLLRIVNVSFLIGIDIMTFFTTAIMIVFVKRGMTNKASSDTKDAKLNLGSEFKLGMKAIGDKKGVKELILVMTISTFCLGFIQILSKPLILSFASEIELGIITTVIAFGMIAGSIAVGWMKEIKSHVNLLSVGLVGCGIFYFLVGVRENMVLIAGFGFMMFAFMPAVQIGSEVLIRKNIPNKLQGRVFGLTGMISQLGYIVAFALSGMLSDFIFEPFMKGNSAFAMALGRVIGIGEGRGIALLIIIVGIGLAMLGVVVGRLNNVRALEKGSYHEAVI